MNTTNTPKFDAFVRASTALTDALVEHAFEAFQTKLPLSCMTPEGVVISVSALEGGLQSLLQFAVLHRELTAEALDENPEQSDRDEKVSAAAELFTAAMKQVDRVSDRDMLPFMPAEVAVAASMAFSVMRRTLLDKVQWVTETGYLAHEDWSVVQDAVLAHHDAGMECQESAADNRAYQKSPPCLCRDCLLRTAAKRFLKENDFNEALAEYERSGPGEAPNRPTVN